MKGESMRKRITAALCALLLLCTPALADFSDVGTDAWYYEAVSWAQENGVMDGVADGVFNPGGGMSRAMFWAVLGRLDGQQISGEAWMADAQGWAVSSGVSDGEDPNGSVTREQLVTMLYRYAGAEPTGTAPGFADADSVSDWAADAVAWASATGIVSGRDGNIFDPKGSATRAECAAIFMRYVSLQPDEPEEELPEEEVPEYTPDLSVLAPNTYDDSLFYVDESGYLRYGSDSLVGIDVSYHQYEIDWAAVAAAGIDFAIIRVGYRGYSEGVIYQDPYFEANITGALANGIEVGVYFFSQAVTVEEAVEEAQQTVEWLRGYDITYPVVFDWERITYSSSRTAETSAVTVTDCALAFFDVIESAGYTGMAYGSPNSVNEDIYIDRLTEYPFWLAHYTSGYEATYYPYHYDIWQYTSDGTVPGIDGRVDLNVCISDLRT